MSEPLDLEAIRGRVSAPCTKSDGIFIVNAKKDSLALLAAVERLTKERDELRVKLHDMHRRAQALEGVEARLGSVREGYKRELVRILKIARALRIKYRRQLSEVHKAIDVVGIDRLDAKGEILSGAERIALLANKRWLFCRLWHGIRKIY